MSLEERLQASAPKPKQCVVRGLRYAQQADDAMWRACVVTEEPFAGVCARYRNNLSDLCRNGLNANMMERHRWFQPALLVSLERYSAEAFFESMAFSTEHFLALQLSEAEYELLGLRVAAVLKLYGRTAFVHEYRRLGCVDLRVAMQQPRLYGIDDDFLLEISDQRTLEALGWLCYYRAPPQAPHIDFDAAPVWCRQK